MPSVMSSLIFLPLILPLSGVIGDTETQSFDFSFSPPCLRVSSEAGGEIFIFLYIMLLCNFEILFHGEVRSNVYKVGRSSLLITYRSISGLMSF